MNGRIYLNSTLYLGSCIQWQYIGAVHNYTYYCYISTTEYNKHKTSIALQIFVKLIIKNIKIVPPHFSYASYMEQA